MQTAFDISLHTGCRLRETRIPLNCIDFAENKITFPSPKGGEDRAFSVPMPSALRPLFERIRKTETKIHGGISISTVAAVAAIFYQDQENRICASIACALPTSIGCVAPGVPREAAMRLVNHASELIHQIYQREKVEDVAQWRDAVQFAA